MKSGRKLGSFGNWRQTGARQEVDADGRSDNIAGIARALGQNSKTFHSWTKRPGFPDKGDDDQWSVPEISAWIASNATGQSENPEFEFERARKMRADASKAEHDLALRRGELVAKVDVERIWSQKNAELFQLIDKHFAKIAPKLSGRTPAEILKALKEMMRTVREESTR